MLLDQTIAGRRCALWVPEGTGPFALSLCCCGLASGAAAAAGGTFPPTGCLSAPKPTGRSTSPPGPRPPCRAAGPLPTAVCWAARPPFCAGSSGELLARPCGAVCAEPGAEQHPRLLAGRTVCAVGRLSKRSLLPVRLPFRLAVVSRLGELFKGTRPEATPAGLPLPRQKGREERPRRHAGGGGRHPGRAPACSPSRWGAKTPFSSGTPAGTSPPPSRAGRRRWPGWIFHKTTAETERSQSPCQNCARCSAAPTIPPSKS